jgi:hypothetical protein
MGVYDKSPSSVTEDGRCPHCHGNGQAIDRILGDARTRDERGFDIEKTKHRLLHGDRICDERTANLRGARIEAFGRGQIRQSEERPLILMRPLKPPLSGQGIRKIMIGANFS